MDRMERKVKRFFGLGSNDEPHQIPQQGYYPPQPVPSQPYPPQSFPPQQYQQPQPPPIPQHSYPHQQQTHHPSYQDSPRKVFAHYMVGISDGQTKEQWITECQTAKQAGIDGFALNIGPNDYWTGPQLQNAYIAAEQVGGFVLFLSFDMACGEWSVDQVVDIINTYKDSPSQMKVDSKAFVSTFEGPGWAENWHTVRERTGDIFLVPDWSSIGPHGVGEKLGVIDGAFSWDAWPQAGQHRQTTGSDHAYKHALRGKAYMMGVSPYFYTHLPQYSKNWYSSSESLWLDRWQSVLDLLPDYVQIITWNDYGESSYICDTNASQIVGGAEKYVRQYDHGGFRAMLPYFIRAYKAGTGAISLPHEDRVVAWYRTMPVGCGSDGGTVWGQGGRQSAAHGARDVVSVVALTNGMRSVSVDIGGSREVFHTRGDYPVTYFEVPFRGRCGPVTVGIEGRSKTGPAIEDVCPPCGHVIFNCVAINV